MTIGLSSSNPSVASIAPPGNITILAGSSTATATITTQGVASSTVVKILATLGTVAKGATLTIKPAALMSVKLSPAALYGSGTSTATVILTEEALPAGATIALASSNASVASLAASDDNLSVFGH